MASLSFATTVLFLVALAIDATARAVTANANANANKNDPNRELSREFIAGYEPYSRVTDHNAIDLDQEAMEQQLALANEEGYQNAFRIYTEGAFTKMVAEVNLTSPLQADIGRGTKIMGYTANGNQVKAKTYEDNPRGIETMRIQYQTFDSQKDYVLCRVGASTTPDTKGCLAPTGTVTIDDRLEIGYAYDPLLNNVAKRTIQKLSLSAKKQMWQCENCPYDLYKSFVEYYGYYDYGNQIVLAAFEGRKTDFLNFNSDFALYNYDGREQIIKNASAYIIIWMYVIREMEDALDDCYSGCTFENCNEEPYYSWDSAAAYYTGMLEGDNGSGSGKLAHALADKRCVNFKTCGPEADQSSGTSKVNIGILKNFVQGRGKLTKQACDAAQPHKDAIEKLMLVPLIQGALRYCWKTGEEAYSEKAEAEGAVFAMAIIPLVHKCNATSAEIISGNMYVGQQGTADFPAVKAAFESTYECLGIDTSLIGGLWDSAIEEYYVGAEPYEYTSGSVGGWLSSSSSSSMMTVVVGAVLAWFL